MLQTVLNGKPRGRQIQALLDAWTGMGEGDEFTHSQIDKILNEPNPSRRRAIVHSAIKRFHEDTGVKIINVRGVGYRVPTGREQVGAGVGVLRLAARRALRGAKVVGSVVDDRLPDIADRKLRDHLLGRVKYVGELIRTEYHGVRALLGTTPPTPRLLPSQEAKFRAGVRKSG